MKTSDKDLQKKGYTLVEMLVTMSIFTIVMAGLMPFYIQSSETIFTADGKLDTNEDVRKITDFVVNEVRESNHFILYDSFSGSWNEGVLVDFRLPVNHGAGRLHDGETGKFLLMVYYGVDPYPGDTTPAPIERLIGIYLSVAEGVTEGPVRVFDIDVPLDSQYQPVESLIPASTVQNNHEILIDDMKALLDGDIFYNYKDRAILMNGQIIHGNDFKQITDTYNFTIAPRG